jgi:hypothetical protein
MVLIKFAKMNNIIVDVKFTDSNKFIFIIKQGMLEMNFNIASPLKFGFAKWKDLRESYIDSAHYNGCKMSDRKGYNFTIYFNENNGNYQYIRCAEGIMEFGMEENRGNKELYCNMFFKIPIELCYNALDKIIEKYSKV